MDASSPTDNQTQAAPAAPATTPPCAVTVLIARRVLPAAVVGFEAAMRGTLAAAQEFPGHLGGQVVPPDEAGDSEEPLLCHVVFACDTEAHLAAWQNSPERAHWLQQVLPHTVGAQQLQRVTGLDYWFAAPDGSTRTAHLCWKVACVTWLGIFPTVLLLFLTVAPLLADWHLVPRLARWLHPWLHAGA